MTERLALALVHHPTVDRDGRVLATAVTALDLHDLARLARTYGLGGVYITTPLAGQRALVDRLLAHWLRGRGGELNPNRREALGLVRLVESLAEARRHLVERWGSEPVLVATSAREGEDRTDFQEARRRLQDGRPGLLVFGTGWGLAPEALAACDWTLAPVRGAGTYNHLSVRSAVSIVVDRLCGER